MKKLVMIAATSAALFFGQAAMANGVSFSIGHHGGAVKWHVNWNGGHANHGNRHRGHRGHRGWRGHVHQPQPRHKPRYRQPPVHCHKQRGHHGHWFKNCHSHGGHHKRHGGH